MNLIKIKQNTKRVGRGKASGKGKTSGRGMNGQKSRTGASTVFQGGGQTSFFMRLPKAKGFKKAKKNYTSINASRLNGLFKEGEKVTKEEIAKRLKIESIESRVKIFGLNNLKEKLQFDDQIILAVPKKK